MEAIESIDRECAALGGLFQQVVNDMKTGVPHYEDFISKAAKLHGHLKNTILALGSFLDTFQKIADAATNTKGATREIGACLTRIVIRHKAMEARMKTLSSALLDCLVLPLQEKMEEWKKVAHSLDKDHSKEYKKLRQELKKKFDNQTKLMKKNKKSSKGEHLDPKVDQGLLEVTKSVRSLHEVEKSAVRRVLVEERSRYCTFVACLKPVLGEEISMVSELQQLEEVMAKLDKHTEDPFKLPEASEQVLSDIKTSEGGVIFQTPPSSPSSLGSRKSSMCSISSAGSSSGGSVSTASPSHQAAQHRHGRSSQNGPGNPLVAPLRLSSISSQDSGFTSQDTLFLRPGSPASSRANGSQPDGSDGDLSGSGGSTPGAGDLRFVQGMPGPPMTDRPHTISSAYEKSHQRPLLQPYTFAPPDRAGTIPEEDERGCTEEPQYAAVRRPPVPQRCISLDQTKPSVPGKTAAAVLAKQKLATAAPQPQGPQQLPNFQCNQPDMVVPQPVYMNMSDLDRMRQQKMQQQQPPQSPEEDSLELKTPTQEDLDHMPPSSSSDGSSSGYGSQNMVCDAAAGYTDVPAPAPLLDANKYQRHALQRPFSFTHGVVPEAAFSQALGAQLGVNGRGTLLRRSCSQVSSKPAPPTRRTPSTVSCEDSEAGQSNTTTPRGSMEFLPPPPPHLLHSDEEPDSGGAQEAVVTRRGPSVADSIKELQRASFSPGPAPGSPGTLRRVQSMSAGQVQAGDRQQIRARLDAALASPRPGGPRAASPSVQGQDQIYAPVAALQQKIQQQQQARLAQQHGADPGLVPHPPGPSINQSTFSTPSPKTKQSLNTSDGSEEYGFGMQFQVQSNNFYHQKHGNHAHPQQQQQQHHPQHQQQQHHPQLQQHHQQLQQQHHPHQQQQHHPQQQQQYPQHPQLRGVGKGHHYPQHDQIMADMDPTLSQRPLPPDIHRHQGGGWAGPGQVDPAAAKVRHWIETRTVSDVRKVRPVLNQEIQQGFQLRKATGVKDRSQPRF